MRVNQSEQLALRQKEKKKISLLHKQQQQRLEASDWLKSETDMSEKCCGKFTEKELLLKISIMK